MRIDVTKTFLPPKEEYEKLLSSLWSRNHITNNGVFLVSLEKKLGDYLGLSSISLVANGTLALQLMIKNFSLKGRILTTPYSYVATCSSILWEGCEPLFVDVDANGNMDVNSLKDRWQPDCVAILATHVYGIPCDLNSLSSFAKDRSIPLMYDAAHAFGVKVNGKSLFGYGDASIASFHATKLFHTVEGGAVFINGDNTPNNIGLLRAFGHKGDQHVQLGINAKMSEFHAAMGHAVLPFIDDLIVERKAIFDRYKSLEVKGLEMWQRDLDEEIEWNYGYLPVLMESEEVLTRFLHHLEQVNIFPRRYFYPALNQLPYLKEKYACPRAEDFASRALCLPMYNNMQDEEWQRISHALTSFNG